MRRNGEPIREGSQVKREALLMSPCVCVCVCWGSLEDVNRPEAAQLHP